MLKREAFKNWNTLLSKALDAEAIDERFSHAMKAVKDLVPSDSCYFIFFRKDQTPVMAFPQEQVAPGQAYSEGAYLLDPFYLGFRDKGLAGTFLLKDIAPRHLPSSKRYREYLSSLTGPVDELAMSVAISDQTTAHLSLSRLIENGRYSRRDFESLEAAAPLLGSLMAQIWDQLHPTLGPGGTQMDRHLAFYQSFGANILTEREYDVAHLLLKGYSAGEIGPILSISPGTARNHMKQIYGKFEVSSQAELAGLFIEQLMAEIGNS
jgi:DNA-binding CsgD family transcriptional regulator